MHHSFWPSTLAGWAAVFAAVSAGIGAFIGGLTHRNVAQVQVTANGRLDKALATIDSVTAERDKLAANVTEAG